MTDPQDPDAALLRTRLVYAVQAETHISWLDEDKKQAVLSQLHHLPTAAGSVARPVPEKPGYLAVEVPEPPSPLILIVYRYTAKLKLFFRVWEIAGLVFPNAIDQSDDRPDTVAALLG
jgi:hypothetical protein